jgi:hypothetical protein
MAGPQELPRLAAYCRFVRMTMGLAPGSGLVNLCRHIVREGRTCVGPFLDDAETDCGLWEGREGIRPLPVRER